MKHFVSPKLAIWHQKWVNGFQDSNFLVACGVLPGGVIVVLFWEKYAVKLNPEFSTWLLEEAKATLAMPLFVLALKKIVLLQ